MPPYDFLPLTDLDIFSHELEELAEKAHVNAQLFQALSDRLETLDPRHRELMALIVVKQQSVLDGVDEQLRYWRTLILDDTQLTTIRKCEQLLRETREANQPLTSWFPMVSTLYH